MLVDTHTHLAHRHFADDLDAVLDRARAAGVGAMLIPATDLPSLERALEIAARHADVYAMAAVHPSEANVVSDADVEAITALAREDRVVGVGESGLDHYWDRTFDARQEELLRHFARVAAETGKPMSLHTRNADDEVRRVIADEQARLADPARLRGVFHCFSGTADDADATLGLGFHLGLGGNTTYKNSPVAAATAHVGLDRIVLETDAPYLAPVPMRGKRNEPAFVAHVAAHLASVRGTTPDAVAAATTATATALFGIEVRKEG